MKKFAVKQEEFAPRPPTVIVPPQRNDTGAVRRCVGAPWNDALLHLGVMASAHSAGAIFSADNDMCEP